MAYCTADVSASGLIGMIDTFDREPKAGAGINNASAGTYSSGCENKPMKRIPKVGAYAKTSVAGASVEAGIFDASASVLSANAGAELSVIGAKAYAGAHLASAQATAGPLNAKAGIV